MIEQKKYVNGEYIPLTEAELAALNQPVSDWMHPQFELRITAPKELAKSYPEMKVWFDINGWAIESIDDDYVHMYCPSIAEEDKPLIRGHKLKVEQLINNEAVEIVI